METFVKDSRQRRDHFYSQLVVILDQLRQHEFDYAGSLMPDPGGELDPQGRLIPDLIAIINTGALEVEQWARHLPRVAAQ